MKSISCHTKSHRVIFLALVFIFAGGLFSPQPVEARMEFVIAMPATEGDPGDDWDSGGAGGGSEFIPPEDGDDSTLLAKHIYPLGYLHVYLGYNTSGLFIISPCFNNNFFAWDTSRIPVPGGSN